MTKGFLFGLILKKKGPGVSTGAKSKIRNLNS